MALVCKYCGGTISIKEGLNTIACDFCGAEQSLFSTADQSAQHIFMDEDTSGAELGTYRRGISMMASARTEKSFLFAAGVFDEIPGVLNAAALSKECRDKATLLQTESQYNNAIIDMNSEDPALVERAIRTFESLGKYKDAAKKAGECKPLLKVAQAKYEEKTKLAEQQRIADEKAKRHQAAKRRFVRWMTLCIALIITVCILVGYFMVYSSSNITIVLSPDADEYVTTTYNGYVFHYDVKIENTGHLDVQSIEGSVLFEKDDEVLVDTAISFYNYSSAVVRAGKNSKFTWELTVSSEDTALALYETDFDELDVRIDITGITYTNGKTKTY